MSVGDSGTLYGAASARSGRSTWRPMSSRRRATSATRGGLRICVQSRIRRRLPDRHRTRWRSRAATSRCAEAARRESSRAGDPRSRSPATLTHHVRRHARRAARPARRRPGRRADDPRDAARRAPGRDHRRARRDRRREFERAGARSGPQLDYGFPGTTCISVNDEAVHGIPGRRRLRRGDLVKLDVTAELDGFYADACRTVAVGDARPQALKLVRASEQALDAALKVVALRRRAQRDRRHRAAPRPRRAASRSATGSWATGSAGASTRRPTCPTSSIPRSRSRCPTASSSRSSRSSPPAGRGCGCSRDGWTVSTLDGSLSAHSEHTIVVREARRSS